MRDESEQEGRDGERRAGRRARERGARIAALLLVAAVAGAPVRAQSIRGFAEVQYQSQDLRGGQGADIERWVSTVNLDYSRRFSNAYDVTLQGEYNDVSYVDLPTHQVNPRGTLRLAHRDFGGFASYRTYRLTDILGVTTRQREATFDAYLHRQGIPQIQGTYLRRRTLAVQQTPAATASTATVTARHTMGPVDVRGNWTNLLRWTDLDPTQTRITQNTFGGGGDWRYARARTAANVTVDAQNTKLSSHKGPSSSTGTAALSLGASQRFSRVFDGSLVYAYQHTSTSSPTSSRKLDNHDGSLLFTARPKPSLHFSTGGGLRTASQAERQRIERYLVVEAGALGRIRHNWTGNASASRSYNWFEGGNSRPVNSAVVNTDFRLARGLEAHAQGQVSKAAAQEAFSDTAGAPTTLTSQISWGFTATPLRTTTVGYTQSSYRTGGSLIDPEATSHSDSWDARWNPVRSFRFSGNLSHSRGLGLGQPTLKTSQATLEWMPTSSLQWTGTYSRSDRAQFNPLTQTVPGTEVWGLRVLASLVQVWRVQATVNDVDPGKPSHVRQWEATLTRILGR